MMILKICGADEWAEAERRGRFEGSAVDAEDGFIHFSTPEQAPETAARYFAGQSEPSRSSLGSPEIGARIDGMMILKICGADEWAEAERRGRFEGSAVDAEDGFIHFSTPEQAPETAARYFAGQSDLVVVAVDPDRLGRALTWEPSRGGDLFPHLYGALALGAVVSVRALPLAEDGRHIFPSND